MSEPNDPTGGSLWSHNPPQIDVLSSFSCGIEILYKPLLIVFFARFDLLSFILLSLFHVFSKKLNDVLLGVSPLLLHHRAPAGDHHDHPGDRLLTKNEQNNSNWKSYQQKCPLLLVVSCSQQRWPPTCLPWPPPSSVLATRVLQRPTGKHLY